MALLLDAGDSRREDGTDGRIEGRDDREGRGEETTSLGSSESSELCCGELMKSLHP
jgi:hypothetical protein